jgi:flagellar FliL protein
MADKDEDQSDVDLNDDSGDQGGGGKKKGGGGLAALLPNLLKFIARGLGAIIFIVTVCIITYNIMNKGGKNQTTVAQTGSYVATKPEYAYFTLLDEISTRTRDATPYTVSVKVNIGYDANNQEAAAEFTARRYQIQDFLRNYFSRKYVADLRPENEQRLKNEIQEQLNQQILDKARARQILFDKLDIMQM